MSWKEVYFFYSKRIFELFEHEEIAVTERFYKRRPTRLLQRVSGEHERKSLRVGEVLHQKGLVLSPHVSVEDLP